VTYPDIESEAAMALRPEVFSDTFSKCGEIAALFLKGAATVMTPDWPKLGLAVGGALFVSMALWALVWLVAYIT
jgi:hypothetical protein